MANWFNIGVHGYGKWPEKEKEVDIDGKVFTLCPLTKENQASFHIDLEMQRISTNDARALMNKFLSHLSWFSHEPYWLATYGVAGGHVKQTNIEREQSMLFEGMFGDFPDRFELHKNPLNLRALAFYRQAQVAEQYSLANACLAYYKILEIEKKNNGVESLDKWINQQLPNIREQNDFVFAKLEKFAKDKGVSLSEFVAHIRHEAAHYMIDSEINLDDNSARELFGHATQPLQDLATRYIENMLEISDNLFSISFHN